MTAPIDLEALRAALAAGPTPGPWNAGSFGSICAGEYHSYANGMAQEQLASVCVLTHSSAVDPAEERMINTAYIAACNPTTIGALVAELTARRARDAEVEALVKRAARMLDYSNSEYVPNAVFDQLRESLAPFTGATP